MILYCGGGCAVLWEWRKLYYTGSKRSLVCIVGTEGMLHCIMEWGRRVLLEWKGCCIALWEWKSFYYIVGVNEDCIVF